MSEYNIWENCLASDSENVKNGTGKNKIPEKKEESLFKKYFEKFKDPLIIILCVILFLSCCITCYEIANTHDYKQLFEPAGILMAIILSTGIGFIFEVKANNEFKILNKVKDDEPVKVIRKKSRDAKPQLIEIKKCDVVKGDLIKLDNGDVVPADGIILESEPLRVDESAYTGEAYTHKSAKASSNDETYSSNMLLRGSIILEGSGYFKVTAVGADTEEGKGAIKLQNEEEVETPLNSQLKQLGDWLTKGSYIIAGLILIGRILFYFLFNTTADHNTLHFIEYLLNTIMIAVTLIVVAVPEGLPMSVTISLALSMRKMLKQQNLVRRLHACETMGAATVICTDKTGTLTQNKMAVAESSFSVDENLIYEAIAINSTAELNIKKDGNIQGIGSPTEVALLLWIKDRFGKDYADIRKCWKITAREPFSSETKFMSTTAEFENRNIRFIKGAPEMVLNMSEEYGRDEKETILKKLDEYQRHALRTLGFAYQESNGPITYMGTVGIADPVRTDVKEAIQTCSHQAGVRVIMVTGDVAATATEIGRQIELIKEDEDSKTTTGQQFSEMSDDEVMKILPELKILSRARPEDKARLVDLLQKSGEVVAVTGDGTNDALALKKAHVGLSMGNGTARAKEVSDITILDNSFSSIKNAIMWGRSLYQNIQRFIIFQMTINLCACLVVLVGAFTGMDSPLTVTQMLWVNLIMDTFAAMALSSLPAERHVMHEKPRDTNSSIITRKMATTIIITGLVFFVILGGLWQLLWHHEVTSFSELLNMSVLKEYFTGMFDFTKTHPHMNPYESGLFFSVFVMVQFWNLFNARYFNNGGSLLKDLSDIIKGKRKASECFSAGFILIALIILIGQIIIVNFSSRFFNVAPLSASDWGLIILTTSIVLVIPEIFRSVIRFTRN